MIRLWIGIVVEPGMMEIRVDDSDRKDDVVFMLQEYRCGC